MQQELQTLQSLSARDRLELIGELWDSLLDEPEGVAIPDWHLEELERRRQLDGGKVEGFNWVTAMDQLRARYIQRADNASPNEIGVASKEVQIERCEMELGLPDLKTIPAKQRLELIEQLSDGPDDSPIPEWHLEELERRLAQYGGKLEGDSGQEFLQRLRALNGERT